MFNRRQLITGVGGGNNQFDFALTVGKSGSQTGFTASGIGALSPNFITINGKKAEITILEVKPFFKILNCTISTTEKMPATITFAVNNEIEILTYKNGTSTEFENTATKTTILDYFSNNVNNTISVSIIL